MVTSQISITSRLYRTLAEVLEDMGLTLYSTFELHSFLGYVVIHGVTRDAKPVVGRYQLTERGNFVRFYPRSFNKPGKIKLAKELRQVATVVQICDVLDLPISTVTGYFNPKKQKPTTSQEGA